RTNRGAATLRDMASSFGTWAASIVLAAVGCMVWSGSLSAQDGWQPAAVDVAADFDAQPSSAPAAAPTREPEPMPSTLVGGMDPLGGSYYYTSPLETFGTNLFLTPYVLGALTSLVYLAVVYPLQALFGSSKVEPVMLWMLLPVAGPWFAQYEDSVKSKPFWRVVLVGDAVVQAAGVVVGLIGYCLSGRRPIRPTQATGVELKLGVEGAGLAGLTLSVRTL
ncbi:MAG TPA: hypothetical protein VMF89_18120, partial [Polyangiales bacterium]|nr:hypothetical protein [Polyangiales bacterium]